MKSSASVDPASRSARTHSQEIQETELAIPSTSAAATHQSSPDPALSPLGRAPVRRSSGTTLGAPLASPEQDAQALAPQPATSSNAATATLARLHRQLASDNARAIAPELAADLISRLRPMKSPGTTGAQARAATHADLVSRISEHDVIDWYKAQGLNENDVATLRRTALLSGLPNPSGSFLTNAMQYIVSPWINYVTGQPWAGAAFGLATMLVAAPVNAVQQSAVVSLCESIREHGAHVIVPDKKQINDKHWLPDLAHALKKKIETFAEACDVFREIQGDPNSSIEQRAAAADVMLAAEKELHQAQHDFVMTQGAHDRQWQGNRWQAIPRILRSPVASTLGLLSKTGAMGPLSATAQTVAAMLMMAVQHVAAGFDEQAKQEANNKLNLLHADVLTDAGKQKLASGAAVSGEDIKADKLRSLIQSPTQALVKRVTAGVAELEKLLADAATAEDAQPGAITADDRDIEASDASKAMQQLRLLRNDLKALREGRLDEIDPNGTASKLLIGAEKSVLSQQLFNDIAKKYNYLEFTAQTAQRIGQMFHLVFLGSAASSVLSKLVSAFKGGTRNVSVAQSLLISAISGGMAAVGALNQDTAITIKNNRREGSTDIGLGKQVGRGIMGAKHETLSQRRATKASKAINAMLDGNDVEALLAAARALSAQEASTSSSQPQGSPSTSRAAPPRREHVSAPSSPNRSRPGQTSNEITRSKSARDLGMELHQSPA
ncbi:type III secretion system effector XopN [Xanthomonas arboricola]|uniref:type III secretion system effector XopN n=1 Tax=Xanthomonas arboricola TaxID=56448 RepID=UPI0021580C6D|nr:type III secretion system effector XopN [Xanthomonas arboricola]